MRGFRLLQREFSTQGTVEKTITKNTVNKEGATIFERINLVERISQLSPWQRRALGAYGALATGSFAIGVYNDGRQSLARYWDESVNTTHTSDWEAAKAGCRSNVWGRFFEGFFFPYTCISNVMPYIVIGTTTKKD